MAEWFFRLIIFCPGRFFLNIHSTGTSCKSVVCRISETVKGHYSWLCESSWRKPRNASVKLNTHCCCQFEDSFCTPVKRKTEVNRKSKPKISTELIRKASYESRSFGPELTQITHSRLRLLLRTWWHHKLMRSEIIIPNSVINIKEKIPTADIHWNDSSSNHANEAHKSWETLIFGVSL